MAEWIRISDGLPKRSGTYLILAYDKRVFVAGYSPPFNCGNMAVCKEAWAVATEGGVQIVPRSKVTHWMPLPKPPVEES